MVTTNAIAKLKNGAGAIFGFGWYEQGGFVDDILVHKVAGTISFSVRQ